MPILTLNRICLFDIGKVLELVQENEEIPIMRNLNRYLMSKIFSLKKCQMTCHHFISWMHVL